MEISFSEGKVSHKRSRKSGSFGAHLDELVKHFDARAESPPPKKSSKQDEQNGCIHDRLFANAWREKHPPKN